MSNSRLQRLLLWCAATDRTFQAAELGGVPVLVGKCIHCGKKLVLDRRGRPLSDASLEHIIPRHHGGTEEPENLAIACSRCNHEKGRRHDCARRDDPKLVQVIATLQARRRERTRAPLPELLAGLPLETPDPAVPTNSARHPRAANKRR
jgi:5-methylcytosine-specific restriction endonuclease McrA